MSHDWDLYDSQHLHTLHARHSHIKSNSMFVHTHAHTHARAHARILTHIDKTESLGCVRGAERSTMRPSKHPIDLRL